MVFYISHLEPVKRARVHTSSCAYRRDGTRLVGREIPETSTTSVWSLPFETLQEAKSFMGTAYSHYADVGMCFRCKPDAV